jgi:predicted dehydrogenase
MGILGLHDKEKIGQKKFTASHAGGYRATDDINLVAAADIDEEMLNTFGDAWDIPSEQRYVDHKVMLETEDLDVVSVCTPSYLHSQHVVDAARSAAGPSVIWCEKPIAASVSAAEEMIDVCEGNVELVINHSFRFTEKLQRLHELVREEDLLGEVKSVNMQFRRELMRNSTHLLDMLVYLLDTRASRISGYLNGENDAVTALETGHEVDDSGGGGMVVMQDGTFTTVDCTVAREISSMALTFTGTEGKLYLNNDDGEWRYWGLEDGQHIEQDLPKIDDSWSWNKDYEQSFPNAARHIEALLYGETENHSPGIEAARSLEIIVGFYISHYTEGHVSVPLARPLQDVTITSW